jgi:hypothetical protein
MLSGTNPKFRFWTCWGLLAKQPKSPRCERDAKRFYLSFETLLAKTAQVTALQVPTLRPTPIRTVQSPPFSTTNGCKISANHGRENTDEEHEAMWQAGSDESRSTLGAGADCEVWIKVVWQFSNKCATDFSPFSRRTVRFPESNRDDSRPPFCAGRNV